MPKPPFSTESTVSAYKDLFSKYGDSPKSLGWANGKQFLRFHQLTRDWDFNGAKILDVGCGFGDFIGFLEARNVSNFTYTGIDLVKEFLDIAHTKHPASNIKFQNADFLTHPFLEKFDYIIASGTLNYKIEGVDPYSLMDRFLSKMFNLCSRALSVDFLTDRVDFTHEFNFHYRPERVLSLAYEHSKNIILRNDFFPFEASLTMYKNDSFKKETTIFTEIEKNLSILGF